MKLHLPLLLFAIFHNYLFGFDNIDVLETEYEIFVNGQTSSIQVESILKIKKIGKQDNISLDLISYDSISGFGMKIEKVEIGYNAVNFNHSNDILTFKTPINQQIIELSVKYSGKPKEGLIFSKNNKGNWVCFADNWPNNARHWLLSNDSPSDKIINCFMVYVPKNYSVISNGKLLENSWNSSLNKSLYVYETEKPIATKVTVIGCAPFQKTELDTTNTGMVINSWTVNDSSTEIFRKNLSLTDEMVDFYSSKISPYPYSSLTHVESKTKYGGMENASAIFYPENAFQYRNGSEVIAHEIAHQWFGNMVTEKNYKHLWLSEGFATYLSYLFLENYYKNDTLSSLMHQSKTKIINYLKQNKEVKLAPKNINEASEMLNVYTYKMGAWVLHLLKNKVGEEKFWQILKQFYRDFKGKNADSEDFRLVVEKVTGLKFYKFFKNYVYENNIPEYSLKWSYSSSKKRLKGLLVQRQQEIYFSNQKIEVKIVFEDGSEEIREIKPVSKLETFYWKKMTKKPLKLMIDPKVNIIYKSFEVEKEK